MRNFVPTALAVIGSGVLACGDARSVAYGRVDPSRDWRTTCNVCHGSDQNAAPPQDTQGNTATSAVGVGAHQSHVTAAHGISQAWDCTACHVKPAEVIAEGHIDGQVTVTGYTGSDAALLAAIGDPGFSAPTVATASCATSYCHGATLAGAGSNKAPFWTRVDGSQAACGTCHSVPPTTGLHSSHAGGTQCTLCHGNIAAGSAITGAGGASITNPALHVNGKVDVILGGSLAGKAWLGTWDCSSCHH